MSRRPGRKGTRAAAEAELRPGERLSVLFPALTPPPDSGGGTAMPGLAPLILAAEHIAWRRHSRATSGASKFPLAPRMFIGLTDSRILVWSARWRWRIGKFLGDITLDQVMAAKAPTVGAGWRTVLIHLAHGARKSTSRCRERPRTGWRTGCRPRCRAGQARTRPASSEVKIVSFDAFRVV